MEPHKHKDLIIAWANGTKIQKEVLMRNWKGELQTLGWLDDPHPSWSEDTKYRIKPRKFKKGAFYPVRLNNNDHAVLVYDGESFIGDCYAHYPESAFSWIGEELSLGWPD